jgi:hypothetical protein
MPSCTNGREKLKKLLQSQQAERQLESDYTISRKKSNKDLVLSQS